MDKPVHYQKVDSPIWVHVAYKKKSDRSSQGQQKSDALKLF